MFHKNFAMKYIKPFHNSNRVKGLVTQNVIKAKNNVLRYVMEVVCELRRIHSTCLQRRVVEVKLDTEKS